MPARPRIRRLDRPADSITKAPEPLPVMITLYWADGGTEDLPGIARAWTANAVLVEWRWPERPHDRQLDWPPASNVRRDVSPKTETRTQAR